MSFKLPKLHPDARPRKAGPTQIDYATLLELCEFVVDAHGWARLFCVRALPDSTLVQITYEPPHSTAHDPPVICTESEENFQLGLVTPASIKLDCMNFLRHKKEDSTD